MGAKQDRVLSPIAHGLRIWAALRALAAEGYSAAGRRLAIKW
jgi:hypothetical protein